MKGIPVNNTRVELGYSDERGLIRIISLTYIEY
jgi:hypothetical protein